MAHIHEHTHDGYTHSHEHSHEGHTHTHEHVTSSKEEALALLTYMLGHNRHHAEELHDLAHNFDGEAHDLLHEAVANLQAGNEKLAAALELLKED
ncbi:MAG: cobalt transporter [Firmicutes bacterium]|nr:cobalt transporter [Bacillota bacterium]